MPDGTYILIDTWIGRAVEGVPTFTMKTTNSSQDVKEEVK